MYGDVSKGSHLQFHFKDSIFYAEIQHTFAKQNPLLLLMKETIAPVHAQCFNKTVFSLEMYKHSIVLYINLAELVRN